MQHLPSRKLIVTTALSLLIISGMGATFALSNPTAYDVRVSHNSTTCFADEHIVACKVDRTTTVTVTVTANQTEGDPSTVTVTETVTTANVAPFYDVYANGQEIGVCWTWAQYQAAVPQYGNVSAQPDSNCHGVPDVEFIHEPAAAVPMDQIGDWGN